jgi:RND family efflux transporter MFP subunit
VVALAIVAGALVVAGVGGFFYWRARSQVNDVPLVSAPKAVAVVEARADTFRPQRRYVATVAPWVQAAVGPQFIAAYADTVLVRPGAIVKRGQVLATLDCRDATATEKAIAMQARAIDARQKALANESNRISSLLDGGFVAPNEAEQKAAGSESELAQLMATQAKLVGSSLAVSDCILRSPFDGEISDRMVDPGAFVRPGNPIVTVVDRSTVRVTAEVPEGDFSFVGQGTPVKVKMLATGQEASGAIARRSPAASDSTRTVHFEIDLRDPERPFPVGTTAEVTIDVGAPQPATVLPSVAAAIRGDKAIVFLVEGDKATKMVVPIQGEEAGTLYLDPQLKPGSRIVTEGRSLLNDGDRVVAKLASAATSASSRSVALTSAPQPVAVAEAKRAMYRASRAYGGTFESWVEAGVGPQFLSAYIDTVLVRAGVTVEKGQLLATLDCRNANATTRAIEMEARAIATKEKAFADEATRVQSMLEGGFVSPDEAERAVARSKSQEAELAAQQATLARSSLTVNDCILRAPFDGEIAIRSFDPGGFVRPGMAIVTVVDRATVRLVADAPETDFDMLKPTTPVRVRVYATNREVMGTISRRSPGTDPETRTVHFEVDVPDPTREIPTNTTGEVHIDADEPVPASEVPLYSASVRGSKAALWVVDGDEVHLRSFDVKGEIGGSLFVDTSLSPGTRVVVEGRELLDDGDRVAVSAPAQLPHPNANSNANSNATQETR